MRTFWQKYLPAIALGAALIGGAFYLGRHTGTQPAPAPGTAPVTTPQTQAAAPIPVPAAAPAETQTAITSPVMQRDPAKSASKPSNGFRRKPDSAVALAVSSQPPVAQAQAPAVLQPVVPQAAEPEPTTAAALPPAQPKPESHPENVLRPDPVMENHNRTPQTVTLPAGTTLAVRLRQSISTDRQSDGDVFTATLDQSLIVNGLVIAEKGSNVRGKITSLERPGRVKGRASLTLELTEINTSDGQQVAVRTDSYRNEATSGTKGDVAKVGGAAALGAIIGAIAGGGKGAAIGAGVGGAAGTGGVLATKGQDARLPSETRLTFKLTEAVTLTEKLN